MPKDERSCWVTVDPLSVYIARTDEGVTVDLYGLEQEDGEAIASCYAFYGDLND